MNYYDELGLRPTATTVEIQQAYRALVRILHPDQQQDPHLRRICDLQLRRLNLMAGVLTNSEERRKYDLTLIRPEEKVSIADLRTMKVRLRFRPAILAWPLVALLLIGLAIFSMRPPSRPVPVAHVPPAAPVILAAQTKSADRIQEPAPQVAEIPAPVPTRTPKVREVAHTVEGRTGVYRARNMEMQVQAHAGRLRGKYRILGGPAAHDITFEFEGREGRRVSVLPWYGASGSRGEVQLKPVDDRAIEVNWITTEAGPSDIPGSGTALLFKAPR